MAARSDGVIACAAYRLARVRKGRGSVGVDPSDISSKVSNQYRGIQPRRHTGSTVAETKRQIVRKPRIRWQARGLPAGAEASSAGGEPH
jgi:hypothetical protein